MCNEAISNFNNLPAQYTLSVRLSYYENTPTNYQPRGYKNGESIDHLIPKDKTSTRIGITGTNHHLFKIIYNSYLNDKLLEVVVFFIIIII